MRANSNFSYSTASRKCAGKIFSIIFPIQQRCGFGVSPAIRRAEKTGKLYIKQKRKIRKIYSGKIRCGSRPAEDPVRRRPAKGNQSIIERQTNGKQRTYDRQANRQADKPPAAPPPLRRQDSDPPRQAHNGAVIGHPVAPCAVAVKGIKKDQIRGVEPLHLLLHPYNCSLRA